MALFSWFSMMHLAQLWARQASQVRLEQQQLEELQRQTQRQEQEKADLQKDLAVRSGDGGEV